MKTIDFWKLFSMATKGEWTAVVYRKDPGDFEYSGLVRTKPGHIIARDCSAADARFIADAHRLLPQMALQLRSLGEDVSDAPVGISPMVRDTVLLKNLDSFLTQMCHREGLCPFEEPVLCPLRHRGCSNVQMQDWEARLCGGER